MNSGSACLRAASCTKYSRAPLSRRAAVTESEETERAQTVETAVDDDESDTGIEMASVHSSSSASGYEPENTPLPARYKALGRQSRRELSDSDEVELEREEKGLSGAQDAAIAGACVHKPCAFAHRCLNARLDPDPQV